MSTWESDLTPGLTFSVELVGPERAKEWLETTKVVNDIRIQRKPLDRRIERYATDMAEQQWPFTGDPIQFSAPDPDTGTEHMINGQNRCHAIIQSEVEIPLLVIRGLPFTLMQQLDIGARRTFVNYLQMNGVANPGDVSALCTLLYHWRTGKFGYKGMPRVAEPQNLNVDPSHGELWALYKRNPIITQAVKSARQVYGQTNKLTITRSQLGLMYILFGEVDVYKREAFFAELVRQEPPIDTLPDYPITTLRDRWGRQGTSARQDAGRTPRWAWLAYGIKVWNAWYEGERIHTLVPPKAGWHNLPRVKGLVDTEFVDDPDEAEEAFADELDGGAA